MKEADRENFMELVAGVYSFYRQRVTPQVLAIWWQAMKQFDLPAVTEAFGKHSMNPDSGQYLPKPADVVRMMGGTTKDAAIVAWAKVDQAIRHVGAWTTVVFDDPLIHRCVDELGGWTWLCAQKEAEMQFLEKRFCDHYRAYKARGEVPAYPAKLLGHADIGNVPHGYAEMQPTFIGDVCGCQQVLVGGSAKTLAITAGDAAKRALAQLEHKT